jgi:hypothetical protein
MEFKPVLRHGGYCQGMPGWRLIADEAECLRAAEALSYKWSSEQPAFSVENETNVTEGCYIQHANHFSGSVTFVWNAFPSNIGTQYLHSGDAGRIQICTALLNCPAQSPVTVEVGNMTKVVRLGKELAHGRRGAHNCSDINPSYSGTVWMECVNGTIVPNVDGCLPQLPCSKSWRSFRTVYLNTTLELVRLIGASEEVSSSTAWENATRQDYINRIEPIQSTIKREYKELKKEVRNLRLQRVSLNKTMAKLQRAEIRLSNLSAQCQEEVEFENSTNSTVVENSTEFAPGNFTNRTIVEESTEIVSEARTKQTIGNDSSEIFSVNRTNRTDASEEIESSSQGMEKPSTNQTVTVNSSASIVQK